MNASRTQVPCPRHEQCRDLPTRRSRPSRPGRVVVGILLLLTMVGLVARHFASPPEMSLQVTRDRQGRLTGWRDSSGRGLRCLLDDRGSVTELRGDDVSVRVAYDAGRNPAVETDAAGSTTYEHDAFGRLVRATFRRSPVWEVRYSYDPFGRVSLVRLVGPFGQGALFRYEYDLLGRLRLIQDGPARITYTYPRPQEVVRTLPNGIVSIFRYLRPGLVESVRHTGPTGIPLADYHYRWDDAGRVRTIREMTLQRQRETDYTWNEQGFLTEVRLPGGSAQQFRYDLVGNRLSAGPVRYEYDASNRLLRAGDIRYEYDRAGYLRRTAAPHVTRDHRWDALGRLIEVRAPGANIRYHYDLSGNLVRRIENGSARHFVPNPLSPGTRLAEYTPDGRMQAVYLYGTSLLGQRTASGTQYFLEDGLSAIRSLVDAAGRVVGSREYSPFGGITGSRGLSVGPFRAAGDWQDPTTGYVLRGGRPYDTRIDRYLAPQLAAPITPRAGEFSAYARAARWHGEWSPARAPYWTSAAPPLPWRSGSLLPIMPVSPYYQTSSARVLASRESARTGSGTVITVLGVNQYGLAGRYYPEDLLRGNLVLQTSAYRYGNAAPWFTFPLDLARGGVNYLLAGPAPGLANIGTNRQVLTEILKHPEAHTLRGFSDGGITLYNLRADLLRAIQTGGLPNLREIRLPGTGLQASMRRYLADRGVNTVRVIEPVNAVDHDPVRIFTTPIWDDPRGLFKLVTTPWALLSGGLRLHNIASYEVPEAPRSGSTREIRRRPERADDTRYVAFHPPGGGGGAGLTWFGPGGLLHSPFLGKPGGVDLDVGVSAPGVAEGITGAVFDPESRQIILVGEGRLALPPIRTEDLLVALQCILTGQPPCFSLDPADPTRPEGRWLQCRYIGPIEGTQFGQAMFDADWLMKAMSFGVDAEGKRLRCPVAGFQSIFDLSLARSGSRGPRSWMRFWITCEQAVLRRSTNGISIDRLQMRVNTEEMWRTRKGLRSSGGRQDPIARRYAEHLTAHFDEYARHYPAFARVRELAAAVVVARWLVESRISLDLSATEQTADPTCRTVSRVTALSGSRSRTQAIPRGTLTRTVHLFGGVDLNVRPKLVPDDGRAARLESAVRRGLAEDRGSDFPVELDAKPRRGWILPLTPAGRSALRAAASQRAQPRARTYHFGDTTAQCRYAEDGSLSAVAGKSPDGWDITGARGESGSRLLLNSPRGDRFVCDWDRGGSLTEIRLNGRPLLRLDYQRGRSRVTLRYPDHTGELRFNARGEPASFSIAPHPGSGGTRGSYRLAAGRKP